MENQFVIIYKVFLNWERKKQNVKNLLKYSRFELVTQVFVVTPEMEKRGLVEVTLNFSAIDDWITNLATRNSQGLKFETWVKVIIEWNKKMKVKIESQRCWCICTWGARDLMFLNPSYVERQPSFSLIFTIVPIVFGFTSHNFSYLKSNTIQKRWSSCWPYVA